MVHRREIADELDAAAAGMHGSPTLLIDGADPFAAPDQPPSLSCRLYRDAAGRAGPAPSVEALQRVCWRPTMTEPVARTPAGPARVRLVALGGASRCASGPARHSPPPH